MTRKRLVLLGGVALIVVLVVSIAGAVFVFADEPTPTPKTYGWHGWGRGFGFGRGVCGQAELEAAAELLGMTADELSTQLWGGRTLADLADKAGVDLQDVRDAVDAANQAAMEAAVRDAIAQAVEDGNLTQEHADWLLEGLDKGFFTMGRSFGFGGMRGGFGHGMKRGFGGLAPQRAPSVAPSSSSL
ncbi:MAG: hypothetical protein ISS50_02900 [Anaerolineae bacterium]|nr:hypothetical protein [Anaerolineae bacterium]